MAVMVDGNGSVSLCYLPAIRSPVGRVKWRRSQSRRDGVGALDGFRGIATIERSQRKLAVAMGLGAHNVSAVSRHEKAAPDGRRRNITTHELDRLADIFEVAAWLVKTRCGTCDGSPPAGFACLTCGARASASQS
jgi:hypothetical protein